MKDALRSSMASEERALDQRFERAENVLALAEAKKGRAAKPVIEAVEQPRPAPKPQPKRPKVLRRTFSLTEDEYDLILELKRRCNLEGFEAPQSEIVRAGIRHLAELSGEELKDVLGRLEKLKPGRAPS